MVGKPDAGFGIRKIPIDILQKLKFRGAAVGFHELMVIVDYPARHVVAVTATGDEQLAFVRFHAARLLVDELLRQDERVGQLGGSRGSRLVTVHRMTPGYVRVW